MIQCFRTIKDLDENLAWLIQKAEGKKVKSSKENFTFPTHRENVIEL